MKQVNTGRDSKQESVEILGSFLLNGGEYAIPVKSFQEVVNPPEKLTPIPLAPAYLLGVFNLRGIVVPVIHLKRLLHLEEKEETLIDKKIGILDHNGVKVGIVFDKTGEIFRYKSEDLNSFKYNESSPKSVVSGAIKMDEGKRIIQILDVGSLLKLDHVPQHASESAQVKQKRHQGQRRQCISFVVGATQCAFNIDSIHEIIKTPNLKDSALVHGNCIGMFELRGDVVPIIDFAALLNYRQAITREQVNAEARVIIMKIENEKFGLLIESVDSIITYYTDEVLHLPLLEQKKSKMFSGCISKERGDVILLNHLEILSSDEIYEITQGHSKIYQVSAHADKAKQKGQRKSYITFHLKDMYAVKIEDVKEIINFPTDLMHPPGLPSFVIGMLNLRGNLISIFDPKLLYSTGKTEITKDTKVIIFEKDKNYYGLLVESVESIFSFSEEDSIKIPEIFYKDKDTSIIGNDVRLAVEIEKEDKKLAILILDLPQVAMRVGNLAKAA